MTKMADTGVTIQAPATLNEDERSRLSRMIETDPADFPDFTIVAGTEGQHFWHVHTRVLSEESSYFKVLLESGFKESAEKRITLPADDPVLIGRMIVWMYYRKIEVGVDPAAEASNAPKLIKLLEADTEAIESLQMPPAGCKQNEHKLGALIATYEVSDKFNIPTLQEEVLVHIKDLIKQDIEVFWGLRDYLKTVEIDCAGIRKLYARARSDHANKLRKQARFVDLREEDPEYWHAWFSKVADDKDNLVTALAIAQKQASKWKEQTLRRKRELLENIYVGKRVKRADGHEYTDAGYPICATCGASGHTANWCRI